MPESSAPSRKNSRKVERMELWRLFRFLDGVSTPGGGSEVRELAPSITHKPHDGAGKGEARLGVRWQSVAATPPFDVFEYQMDAIVERIAKPCSRPT
jgi:hypothetical protein